jgi:hypothetical protein
MKLCTPTLYSQLLTGAHPCDTPAYEWCDWRTERSGGEARPEKDDAHRSDEEAGSVTHAAHSGADLADSRADAPGQDLASIAELTTPWNGG